MLYFRGPNSLLLTHLCEAFYIQLFLLGWKVVVPISANTKSFLHP